MSICKFCNHDYVQLNRHEKYCSNNPLKIPFDNGRRGKKHSEESKKKISNNGGHSGKASTPEKEELRRKKISNRMKLVGGGYRLGSGIGKSGWYQDIWCDSSWELAFVLWCKLNGKNIIRNKQWFEYTYNGKNRKYYPDFLVEGVLYEIKGRRIADDLIVAKSKSCPSAILLLDHDMKPILSEVIKIYGKDFIKLYRR